MVEGRPDWCVSRQRAWGVPIAVFTQQETGEPLRDPAVVERVAAAVETRRRATSGSAPMRRSFSATPTTRPSGSKVTDIIEVWFDSGSTHAFVLEQRPELKWPASLYLEGSDQHRGWFHSSLLEACGTRGRAPYDAVLTHGFVLDEDGRKMSKSLGNVVAPQDVMQQSGADILRLWVVGSDYSEDLRIGPEILKHHSDIYRRLRNTLRYLLGRARRLFAPTEAVGAEAMPELERWVLHRLAELDALVRQAVEAFDFHAMFTALHNFCAADLSAFYFDIRKDRLYCDAPDDSGAAGGAHRAGPHLRLPGALAGADHCASPPRRPGSPAMATRRGAASISRLFADVPAGWLDPALGERWAALRDLRRVATGALELERGAKRHRVRACRRRSRCSSPTGLAALLRDVDLAELCITSAGTVRSGTPPEDAFTLPDVAEIGVVVSPTRRASAASAAGACCPRSGSVDGHADLCRRCAGCASAQMAGAPDDRRGSARRVAVVGLDQLSEARAAGAFRRGRLRRSPRAGDAVFQSRADLQSRHELRPVQHTARG